MAVGLLKHFNARRAFRDAEAIWKLARWCTTKELRQAAGLIVNRLKAAGIPEARVLDVPSDGRTSVGGWVMPKAWDVKAATLSVVDPKTDDPVLADFRKSPQTLMLWSPPTSPGGTTAEVVLVKDLFGFRGTLKGRFVLLEDIRGQVSVRGVQELVRRGAVGLISDYVVPDPGVKEGAYLDDASQYRNNINPSWDHQKRLPAFSITPRKGKLLRKLLSRGRVKLRARVDSRLYDGKMPVVTACLPGTQEGEIVLTGHMDEPGASDNASGVAVAMEVLRAIAAYVKRRRRPLRHGVRVMFSGEVKGIQGYLNLLGHPVPVVAGLNLDMIGASHQKARSSLYIESSRPAGPSFLDELLAELVRDEAKKPPLFRWRLRKVLVVDDCQFAAAPCSAPMCFIGQPHERTYHTSLDTPDVISAAHMRRTGGIALRATAFLADAEYEEILALAGRTYRRAAADVRAGRASRREAAQRVHRVFSGLDGLLRDGPDFPSPVEVAGMRAEKSLVNGHLYPRAAFAEKCASWEKKLGRRAPAAAKRRCRAAEELVPVKGFAGYLGWEDMAAGRKKRLLRETGVQAGWGPAEWLQMALDLSDGRRTLAEICAAIERDGIEVNPSVAVKTMRFLARDGKVTFRKILEKKDILRSLRRVGIRRGDLVAAHTSLSAFGYVRGGADTVLDALLNAVGRTGTLAMPTHSESWLGRTPYDPRTSPSRVGAVTNVFLRRPGVKRSLHPTHSVAAIGPLAKDLLAGHDHTVAPQGRDGFWGRFHDADGEVLLMCPPRANTILHAAEVWAGLPYPSTLVHFMKKGRRVEAVVPGMPWHVDHFDRVNASLLKNGRMRTARLGEGEIYSVSARDAAAAATRLVRRNPQAVLPKGCDCRFCRHVRSSLRKRGHGGL